MACLEDGRCGLRGYSFGLFSQCGNSVRGKSVCFVQDNASISCYCRCGVIFPVPVLYAERSHTLARVRTTGAGCLCLPASDLDSSPEQYPRIERKCPHRFRWSQTGYSYQSGNTVSCLGDEVSSFFLVVIDTEISSFQ